MQYRISVEIVFLQLTEYKIEMIAKFACKAAGAMHNARTACTCIACTWQLTMHADVHESKCGYYRV